MNCNECKKKVGCPDYNHPLDHDCFKPYPQATKQPLSTGPIEVPGSVADTDGIVGLIEKYANSLKNKNRAKHILKTCEQLRFLLDKTD